MPPKRIAFVVTCEHGGNAIPRRYRHLFHGQAQLLSTHRALDIGAFDLARSLARILHAPLFYSTTSRLVIDLNRSLHHRRVFSEFTRSLTPSERELLISRYYRPYRARIEDHIARRITAGARVVHVSAHSFTPILDGRARTTDIGLLYDPSRSFETRVCRAWQELLTAAAPELRVRRNYPYRGTADGFTSYLRTRFPNKRYAGIELEVIQGLSLESAREWRACRALLARTLAAAA